jgi:hypothetical protein
MADELTPPTDDEVAAASAVLARRAQAEIAARNERLRPLREIVGGDDFVAVTRALAGLPTALLSDNEVYPHLNAIRTGMNGLTALMPPSAA